MRRRNLLLYFLIAVSVGACSRPTVMPPAPRPLPVVNRVLIISIDGLRPDLALRADTPRIRRLLQTGCYSFWARTTEMSVTLPSHTSMLTGVTPNKHKVTWNTEQTGKPQYPAFPTLFEVAKRARYTTGMVAGKLKFTTLAKRGTLDWVSARQTDDVHVARAAVAMIDAHQPQVMFVHFPDVDLNGHSQGWGSPAQVAAVERVDALLGSVLDALDNNGLTDATLVIVTADHGGAGRTHGRDDPRSRHIPWIASNPHLRQAYDLTQNPRLVINTEDTFATACLFLGIGMDQRLDGKPIAEIVPSQELLHATR